MKRAEFIVMIAIALIASVVLYRSVMWFSPVIFWMLAGAFAGLSLGAIWLRKETPALRKLSSENKKSFSAMVLLSTSTVLTIGFLGIGFVYFGIDYTKTTNIIWTWPETQATVSKISVHETAPTKYVDRQGRFSPVWHYSFRVNGVSLESHSRSVAFGNRPRSIKTNEAALLEGQQRPVGSTVTIFYNPEDPSESVMDRIPYDASDAYLFFALAVALMVIGGAGYFFLDRKMRQRLMELQLKE